MNNEFDSQFCNVKYVKKDNVVLLTWKKFCCLDDYRAPTMFACELLAKHTDSCFVVDAKNGFEDDKADVECGFSVLLPSMAKAGCKICVFILNEDSDIDDEIDLWTKEFKKYFKVIKVHSYKQAINQL